MSFSLTFPFYAVVLSRNVRIEVSFVVESCLISLDYCLFLCLTEKQMSSKKLMKCDEQYFRVLFGQILFLEIYCPVF